MKRRSGTSPAIRGLAGRCLLALAGARRASPARRLAAARRDRIWADSGSVTPLAIGLSVIALALIVTGVSVTDLYLAQRKLFALADSAALSAADSFAPAYGDAPGVRLSDEGVRRAAHDYLERAAPHRFDELHLEPASGSPDGRSARIVLSATVRPVLLSPFLPGGVEVRAHSSVRGGLRLE